MLKYQINCNLFRLCIQLKSFQFLYLFMFEENSQDQETINNHLNRIHETNEQRMQRIKKTKNIRKEKVLEKRNQNVQKQQCSKTEVTKGKTKEMQKEKNRVAAQLSRDRQKKYIQDLESKVIQMEKQIQCQLCRKCKASLTEHSSTDDEHFIDESKEEKWTPVSTEKQYNEINILMKQPQIQSLPFVRDDSRSDIEWGAFGKYFCVILVVLAIGLFSSSIQIEGSAVPRSPTARILTEQPVCERMDRNYFLNTNLTSNDDEIRVLNNWPYKDRTGQLRQQCKNNFWQYYLQNVKKQINPYSWNFVTCSEPNLTHISTVYENAVQSQQKWTNLITNPSFSHSNVEQKGQYYIDEVSYLDEIYQAIKVVSKNVLWRESYA